MQKIIDVDQYIAEISSFLDQKFGTKKYDKLAVAQDLKEYIYDQAGQLAEKDQLQMDKAVNIIIDEMGPPEVFADKFIKEIANERRYLIFKIFIATVIAFLPFIIIIYFLLTN